jgi:outer membrane protein OmpA-like peptidoglycan-associated protein
MTAEKKRVFDDASQIMMAARLVPFFMSFVMLFIPFIPLLVSCQGTNTTISAGGEGRLLPSHDAQSTIVTAIQDAAVGGSSGNIIARQMDIIAGELTADMKGIAVERIAEGILITIDSRILFKDDCVDLLPSAKNKFKDLSRKLRTHKLTNLLVEGHTDNTAEKSYNYYLSEMRARAVEKYLVGLGIQNGRIRARGFGEKQPLFSNDNVEGKQANRRVELALYASDEMKTMARNGNLGEYLAAKK